jgi:hypothetical protein
MVMEFDPKFVKEYAGKLSDQSKSIIPAHFFIGLLIGLLIFAEISSMLMGTYDFLIMAIGVLIGAFMGLGSGYNKAAELRLRAQELLCQVKMEENSRR